MKARTLAAAAAAASIATLAFAQSDMSQPGAPGGDGSESPAPAHQALSEAASALRESIVALEGQEAGTGSESALRQARAALLRTQNAIVLTERQVREVDEAAKREREEEARAAGTAKAPEAAKLASGPAKESAPEPATGEGCWVRLHDEPNFAGSALTLTGGLDAKEVTRQVVPGWKGAGSVVVGPTARLVAKKEGATLTIAPGQELEDVRNTVPPGLFASLDSMQVSCGA